MANVETALPELSEWMQNIAVDLLEAGPVLSNEAGWQKLAWAELAAFTDLGGGYLTTWETQTIMLASSAYAAGLNEYYNKPADAPFDRILTEAERAQELAQADKEIEDKMSRLIGNPDRGDNG